jgi:diguanylate cyclase (GGDEF)-like protein
MKPNILIIEDSSLIAEALVQEFSHIDSNLNLLVAQTLQDAKRLIREHNKDIGFAILDLNIPDATEEEVLSLIASHRIPSIVLTGQINSDLIDLVFKKGAYDYIIKNGLKSIPYAAQKVYSYMREYPSKILVVDDSNLYRNLIKQSLQHLKVEILEAHDGIEAKKLIDKPNHNISLIITDYNMPNMDGLELILQIRSVYNKDELAIIAMSAVDDPETTKNFLKVGANDFIHKPFSEAEMALRIHANLEVIELFQRSKDLANRDYLTNAYNRRYFFEASKAITSRAKRAQGDLAVATIDIDFFKKINDTYGHDIGDVAIKEVIRILNQILRDSDLSARFGGEEFCVLLENISFENLQKLFERIRAAFEKNIITIKDQAINYTVSTGVYYGEAIDVHTMLELSDKALYEAKDTGRNKVVYFDAETKAISN